MMRLRLRFLLTAAFGTVLLLVSAVVLVVTTDRGSRWLLSVLDSRLPEALTYEGTRGSLASGLYFDNVRWSDDALDVVVDELEFDIDIYSLLRVNVHLHSVDAAAVSITRNEIQEQPPGNSPFSFSSPLPITIDSATLNNVVIRDQSIEREFEHIELSANLLGSKLSVPHLSITSALLSLTSSGEATLTPPYENDLRLRWNVQSTADEAAAGELVLSGTLQQLNVEHQLTSPVVVQTSGVVSNVTEGIEADLTSEWQNIAWLSNEGVLFKSENGEVRARGNHLRYELTGNAVGTPPDLPELALELNATGDLSGLDVQQLRIASDFGDAQISGAVGWETGLAWSADYQISDLDPSVLVPSMDATLNFEGNAIGRTNSSNAPEIVVRIDQIDGAIQDTPLDGRATMTVSNNTISVSDAELISGDNKVSVVALLANESDIDIVASLGNLQQLHPDFSGSLNGELKLSGNRERPTVNSNLTATAGRWKEYQVGQASLQGQWIREGKTDFKISAGKLQFGDQPLDSLDIAVTGTEKAHVVNASAESDHLQATVLASGGLSDNEWQGIVNSIVIGGAEFGRWQTETESTLSVSPNSVAVPETCLQAVSSSGSACLELQAEELSSIDFSLAVTQLPVSALPINNLTNVEIDGLIEVTASGQLHDKVIDGEAELQLAEARIFTQVGGEETSVEFQRFAALVSVVNNQLLSEVEVLVKDQLGSGSAKLTVDNMLAKESAIDGNAQFEFLDLTLLSVLQPTITDPSGQVSGDLAFAGTIDTPRIVGDVGLRDGTFGISSAGIVVTDAELILQQQAPGSLQIDGKARSGNGEVSIQGETTFSAENGVATTMQISGEQFELLRLPDWHATASPNISVTIDERVVDVSGKIFIPEASIAVDAAPTNAVRTSPDAVVHDTSGSATEVRRRTQVEVDISAGDAVRFAGFGLTTRFSGDVRLRGSSGKPWLGDGRLQLHDGRYSAYGQSLEVERGELIFNGPLDNPLLDVRALRRTEEVTAGIQLSGTATRINSTVFSEPQLSDAEALSYLITGRPLAQASSTEGNALNNAAFALGLSQAGAVTSQIRSSLGLDTLAVRGGPDSSRIVAGKRLGSRLLVEYGYGLVDKLGTLLLRYQLNERLIIESGTGSVSTVDLIYNVRRN